MGVDEAGNDQLIGRIDDLDVVTAGDVGARGEIGLDAGGGEFPTSDRPNGEIPRTNGKPNSGSGSVLGDLLKTISTEALIEECARRGLKVGATNA